MTYILIVRWELRLFGLIWTVLRTICVRLKTTQFTYAVSFSLPRTAILWPDSFPIVLIRTSLCLRNRESPRQIWNLCDQFRKCRCWSSRRSHHRVWLAQPRTEFVPPSLVLPP